MMLQRDSPAEIFTLGAQFVLSGARRVRYVSRSIIIFRTSYLVLSVSKGCKAQTTAQANT